MNSGDCQDDRRVFAEVQKRLHTTVIGGLLDTMGFYQNFLPREIQPLQDSMVVPATGKDFYVY
jgi:hypothetical protein